MSNTVPIDCSLSLGKQGVCLPPSGALCGCVISLNQVSSNMTHDELGTELSAEVGARCPLVCSSFMPRPPTCKKGDVVTNTCYSETS